MTSFILFPTIKFIHQAALVCRQKSLSIGHITVTSRFDVNKKIDAAIKRYSPGPILLFAPFIDNDEVQTVLGDAISANVEIDWYGEFSKNAYEKLKKHEKLRIHRVEVLPKIPKDIEIYLKYKKTLSFLGDKSGNFAISHLKEAIEHLSQSTQIPEDIKQSLEAFEETDFPAIEGRSRKMTELKRDIHRVAGAGLDKILLLGETGTGKEAAAFFLHTLDPKRRKGKFGSINCAVLQEELLISELFGHEEGAFTGATKQKRGLVSDLDGGTLFLDELPDLPPRAQAMLLRFLESGFYTPLGSTQTEHANTKIVSAAQKSLLIEKLRTKQFRQDLYYRVAGKTIVLPSLKEIPEDIPSLIVHLAYKIEQNSEKRDQAISYFFEMMDELKKHRWPGNVRELANYIARRVKLGTDEDINLNEINLFSDLRSPNNEQTHPNQDPTDFLSLQKRNITNGNKYQIDSLEKIKRTYTKLVYDTLLSQNVSQSEISKQLGISVNTLKRLILGNHKETALPQR